MGVALAIWEFLDKSDRPYATRSMGAFMGLLRSCERRGDEISIDVVLGHMRSAGLRPTLAVYNLVMQTYGKAGLAEQAAATLRLLLPDSPRAPQHTAPHVIGRFALRAAARYPRSQYRFLWQAGQLIAMQQAERSSVGAMHRARAAVSCGGVRRWQAC